ncbi:MAG TPA: ACT domain-containing protein, partial [Thermodesulfobacteriota bacterium]|nr:ACT domain-containing protein [Thermodesulfobacteriota bacterium]
MAKARKLKQINFTMPNKVGLLSEVTSAMAGAKVNINTITAYEMEDKAHFMLTTDSNAKAKRALAKLGVEKTTEDEVIAVEMPNK